MEKKTNLNLFKKSLHDLILTYEPPPSKAVSFVTWFVKKFRDARGYEAELLKFAKEEIAKLVDTDAE